jgi:acetolactate synthase-1/2/3 large subunit
VNGVSGAIGGGIGYAIGAKAAAPSADVVALMGDGTAGFHLSEFETAVREGFPFVAVIGNDRRWNAEHELQRRNFGEDRMHGCILSGARYDEAVAALGGFGAHVTSPEDLSDALRDALASGRPACVNVEIEGLPAPVLP